MSSYAEVVNRLGIKGVCGGGCGLSEHRHRAGCEFMWVLHWSDRRVTRRGLRRFLLLVAKRKRELAPAYLNDPKLGWFHLYDDNREADKMAAKLGVRFPVEFSRTERWKCLWLAHKAKVPITRTHPALYSWAVRGLDR